MSLSDELALINKLKALDQPNASEVFAGITTQAERKEKARTMVKKVADVTFRIEGARRITMEMAFCRAYGEFLESE